MDQYSSRPWHHPLLGPGATAEATTFPALDLEAERMLTRSRRRTKPCDEIPPSHYEPIPCRARRGQVWPARRLACSLTERAQIVLVRGSAGVSCWPAAVDLYTAA